ncbi:hypothetical protein EYF80_063180 [Liparis tanakae]|uniref:Uncharacterized protein n=1 Tax=Liparis tanakae TaxID=230148 RepID=A0A4Z2EDW2_9TELE|nr:hypothetical protein EYF80_063180 [Liparis tanakae]
MFIVLHLGYWVLLCSTYNNIYCVSRNKPRKRAALLLLLLLLQAQLPLLHHTWSDMAGHQKINLFPLHLFKTLLICCLPIKGLAPGEEPIERHEGCETQANPQAAF